MKSDVIIVASGKGSRFGGDTKKQFLELDGIPIIAYTIQAFEKSKIDNIYIVTSKDEVDNLNNILNDYDFKKVKGIFEGGRERYLSVYNGLCAIEKTETDVVLIHDGVRPFVEVEKINSLIDFVEEKGSCILATKTVNTLKLVDDNGIIKETVDRKYILNAQTPQGFNKNDLIKYYKLAVKENAVFTDDSSVMEYFGQQVHTLEDSYNNIKITTQEDIAKCSEIIKNIKYKPTKILKVEENKSSATSEVVIYTDGACSGNPGKGGYGIVMFYGEIQKEFQGGFLNTTNNRMELLAVIDALAKLNKKCDVKLYTDSRYVSDAINKKWIYGWQKKGWKKSDGKPVLNLDLWKRLVPLLSTHNVEFIWVKGHADNEFNERCDFLARDYIINGNLTIDENYK